MKAEELIGRAVHAAIRLHQGQTRDDGTTPNVNHPIRVGFILQGHGADAETVCAGLLHDTIEDTEASWDTLRVIANETVADLVVGLSQDKRLPREVRKRQAIEHLATADDRVRMVKLADRLDNVREIWRSGWTDARKAAYAVESRQILAAARAAHPTLAAQLEEAIQTLEALVQGGRPEGDDG